MQINRLFEIVYLLLEKQGTTARELAEHFEVSVRTVYRDIDTLCQAGIPIYTNKGRGGGIHLMDNFILDKSVLSDMERQEILWGLQGLNAVKAADNDEVLSRMRSLFGAHKTDWVQVDFSDWTDERQKVFGDIKEGIICKKVIEIDYYNSAGVKSSRQVEPLQLWFKDKSWYLKGFCRKAGEMRLFRITRMKQVKVLEENFERVLQMQESNEKKGYRDKSYMVEITLHIDASCAYRVYDEFEESQIQVQEDGSFLAKLNCPENEWVYGYILSYGPLVRVTAPERVKNQVRERLEKTLEFYSRSQF